MPHNVCKYDTHTRMRTQVHTGDDMLRTWEQRSKIPELMVIQIKQIRALISTEGYKYRRIIH